MTLFILLSIIRFNASYTYIVHEDIDLEKNLAQIGMALPGEARVLRVYRRLVSLNNSLPPPVTGALGVIGYSGRASYDSDAINESNAQDRLSLT